MHQFTPQADLKPFPPAKLQALLDDLEKFRPAGRAIAAFDADGTLWNTDMGEAFFNYQIENRLVPLPPDPFGHYNWMKDHVGHTEAYLWLAQVLKGVPLERVREWAEKSVASSPLPVFDEVWKILEKLRSLNVEIYVVTASITWAVEPGARRLGLQASDVIGIETEVVDGLVTVNPRGVITYREGKAQAILARTGGVAPYFCAGNTEGDHWLLEAASAVRLVMSSAPIGTENFPTESKMLALARERGWHWHRSV
jgi:phosphoserine phosphatase